MKYLYYFFLSIALFAVYEINAQTIYYVSKNGNDSNDGKSWATAFLNPQTAIDAAGETDQVWVAEGVYYPTKSVNNKRDPRDRTFVINKKRFCIYGGFSGTEQTIDERKQADLDGNGTVEPWEFVHETILSGDIDGKPDVWTWNEQTKRWDVANDKNNAYCVVYIGDPVNGNGYGHGDDSVTLFDGFSVTGANSSNAALSSGIYNRYNGIISRCKVFKNSVGGYGGGIYSYDTTVDGADIKNCAIFNNRAYGNDAGGVYAISLGGAENCWIYNNTAGRDGGGGIGRFSNCRIFNNYARSGGGIGGGSVTDCIIYNNEADEQGGGVYTSDVWRCRIYNNRSPVGGGIFCSENDYNDVKSSLVFNNSSGISGEGIVESCTVANNGVMPAEPEINSYEYTRNNIFWNDDILTNEFFFCASNLRQLPGCNNINLEDCPFVRPTSFRGVAATAAQQRELESADWRLRSGSECIDAGVYDGLVRLDIDGIACPQHSRMDMGAYEYVFSMSDAVEMPYVEDFKTFPPSVKYLAGNWECTEYSEEGSVGLEYKVAGDRKWWNRDSYVVTPYFLPEDTVTTLSYDLVYSGNGFGDFYVVVQYLGEERCDTVKIYSKDESVNGNFSHILPDKCGSIPFSLFFYMEAYRGFVECALDNIVVKGHNYNVGMEDVEEKKFRIYPNPFSDVFYIEGEEGTRVTVYDFGGTLLYEDVISAVPHIVPCEGWYSGSYLVCLTGKDGCKSWKAVKK